MREIPASHPHRFALAALALLALAAGLPALAGFDQERSFQTDQLTVHNMIGEIRISGHGGSSFEVLVHVRGDDDIMVRYAQCCNPLPGDSISGLTTLGQGLSVHSEDCANLMNVDSERLLEVAWAPDINITRPVNIEVLCRNEKGVLAEMTNAIRGADANISSAEIGTNPENKAVCTLVVDVRNTEHLKAIMLALKRVSKVMKVKRLKKGVSNRDDERV